MIVQWIKSSDAKMHSKEVIGHVDTKYHFKTYIGKPAPVVHLPGYQMSFLTAFWFDGVVRLILSQANGRTIFNITRFHKMSLIHTQQYLLSQTISIFRLGTGTLGWGATPFHQEIHYQIHITFVLDLSLEKNSFNKHFSQSLFLS